MFFTTFALRYFRSKNVLFILKKCTFRFADYTTIDEAYFYVKDIEEYIMFDLFYDIEECIETYEEFSEDFPQKSLVIGADPGGAMLLLVTTDVGDFSKGIYFYDHAHFFQASNSDCNTYFVCDTFSEFITILEHTTLP